MKYATHGLLALVVFCTAAVNANAHENEISQTIEINAPAAEVWEMVGNFHAIHRWLPGVAETVSDGGTAPGTKRELVLEQGPSVYEQLEMWNAETMSLGYSIPDATHDVTVLPVKGYSSEITVIDTGGASLVTWTGRFYAPDGMNDADAVGPVNGLYKIGLDNLKSLLEP